jgi:WD40 repeat protein
VTTVAPPLSPYKGLAAFEDSDLDALFFFGRERDSEVIAANLMASRLTVLFGPTGVGKTSVLRAGVAYRLRREAGVEVLDHSSWTGDPVAGLLEATALATRTGGDVYLILDQFEEYFLYHEHDRAFVDALAEIVRRPDLRVNVLIGIREDTLARLDAFKAEIPNLLSNRLRLHRLDRAAGEAAIVGPIGRYNELVDEASRVDVEPELVRAVLDEVTAGRVDLGGLGQGVVGNGIDAGRIEAPYLQLVMSRLWEVERDKGSAVLRHETLRELGGAAQIVHDHLELAMADLSPEQKDAAAAMYNFLLTPSGTKIAHGVSDLAGYAEIDEAEAAEVLRRLADERIVRASAENGAAVKYEIYHDVLADAVSAWRNRYRAERALHDAERRRRRAFAVATAALVALLLVGAIAVFALTERSHAKSEARRAHARELTAAATSLLDVDPQQSIRNALQAAGLERGTQEEDVLRLSLLADLQRGVLRAKAPVLSAHFDPTGRRIITASRDGKARIYKVGSDEPERVFDHGRPVTTAIYSPDGRLILTAGRDGTARIWGKGDTPLRTLKAGGPVTSALFAKHGSLVVTLARTGLIRIWRTADGRLLRTIRVHGKAIPLGGAVSPAGVLLVTFGHDRFAHVYSVASGELLETLAHVGFVHCASFHPKGSFFVTCDHDGLVRLWSTRTGRQVRVFRGPERGSAVVSAVWSPNGVLVAAAVADGTARVWEAPTGQQIGIMIGHSNPVTAVAFSPTGNGIATGSADGHARTWLKNGKPVAILIGHTGRVNAIDFSRDGRSVVTASNDWTARVWSSRTEPELALVARQAPIRAFAVDAGGRNIAVADAHGIVRVRPLGRSRITRTIRTRAAVREVAFGPRGPVVATGPTVSVAISGTGLIARGRRDGSIVVGRRVLRGGAKQVTALGFSRDGRLLASGDSVGVVRLWNLRTGRSRRPIHAHVLGVTSVAVSPDGKILLTAGRDGEARTWSIATRKLIHSMRWHFGPLGGAAFSPDGRWIVTAGPTSTGVGLVSTGRRLLLLQAGVKEPLVGAAFAGADGRTIVAAGRDGSIRQFRCDVCGDLDDLVALAKRRLRARRG